MIYNYLTVCPSSIKSWFSRPALRRSVLCFVSDLWASAAFCISIHLCAVALSPSRRRSVHFQHLCAAAVSDERSMIYIYIYIYISVHLGALRALLHSQAGELTLGSHQKRNIRKSSCSRSPLGCPESFMTLSDRGAHTWLHSKEKPKAINLFLFTTWVP